MKKLFYIISVLFILNITFMSNKSFSQSGWIVYSIDNSFSNIFFSNTTTGWAISGYVLYKTTNGGLNWINIGVFQSVIDYSFLNENTGYVAGQTSSVPIGIFKTTNGGLNWNTQFTPTQMSSMKFLDFNTGFISGSSYLSRTTNGGLNWQATSAQMNARNLTFPSLNTGYCSVEWNKYLYKSINNGLNWTVIHTFSAYQTSIQSITFVNDFIGCVLYRDTVFKTTNGGYNWTSLINAPSNKYDVYFVNENKGWVCGSIGMIFNTTNGGNTWNYQFANTLAALNKIQFLNESTGFIYGSGVLLKTTTGGSVFVQNISSEIPDKYNLLQNYPNPFNPSTKIKFEIPKSSNVKISVYDIRGKEIEVLSNEKLNAGTYQTEWNGMSYSSGVYFYKIQTEEYAETKKMILIK